jgi:hypothetical protein
LMLFGGVLLVVCWVLGFQLPGFRGPLKQGRGQRGLDVSADVGLGLCAEMVYRGESLCPHQTTLQLPIHPPPQNPSPTPLQANKLLPELRRDPPAAPADGAPAEGGQSPRGGGGGGGAGEGELAECIGHFLRWGGALAFAGFLWDWEGRRRLLEGEPSRFPPNRIAPHPPFFCKKTQRRECQALGVG